MALQLAADLVVLLHLLFIVFAVFGGFVALRWPGVAALHLPAVLWAGLVELLGWTCPLTPLESRLRAGGGSAGYDASFVEHYVLPIVYPAALTRDTQVVLGIGVVLVNVAVYAWLWRRRARPS